MRSSVAAMMLAGAALAACAPALDWREVRAADTGVALLLPCKPTEQVRRVTLAGATVQLQLLACSAGGSTWALAHADMQDPARVGPALDELADSAAANLRATPSRQQPLQVPGATPNPGSRRLDLSGRMPDGRAVDERLALFTWGTRVFQATVLGERVDGEAVESFFASLRVVP